MLQKFKTGNNKVCLLADTHFGARADNPAFHEYFRKFYDEIFFPYLVENKIKFIFHFGDVTDRRKYINLLSLNKLKQYFFDKLSELGIHMMISVGNHDTYHKNTNKINSVVDLFGFYPNVNIYSETTEISIDGRKIIVVPWINSENHVTSMEKIESTDSEICFGHLELKGFLLQKGQRSDTGMESTVFDKFKMVGSGHYHHKSDEKNIHYLGSPYEFTFVDLNDPKGFHIWNTKTDDIDFIQNPHKMFYKIFYDDRTKTLDSLKKKIKPEFAGSFVKVVVKCISNPGNFDLFKEHLYAFNPADVKIEEDINLDGEDTEKVDLTEDTITVLENYIDSLDLDVDKNPIKKETASLYQRAMNME